MNPFDREKHLESRHRRHLEDAQDLPAQMTSDDSRALHRYFHALRGTYQSDHDHNESDY